MERQQVGRSQTLNKNFFYTMNPVSDKVSQQSLVLHNPRKDRNDSNVGKEAGSPIFNFILKKQKSND